MASQPNLCSACCSCGMGGTADLSTTETERQALQAWRCTVCRRLRHGTAALFSTMWDNLHQNAYLSEFSSALPSWCGPAW